MGKLTKLKNGYICYRQVRLLKREEEEEKMKEKKKEI